MEFGHLIILAFLCVSYFLHIFASFIILHCFNFIILHAFQECMIFIIVKKKVSHKP